MCKVTLFISYALITKEECIKVNRNYNKIIIIKSFSYDTFDRNIR